MGGRNQLEICMDILRVCASGPAVRPTRIQQKANLGYSTFNKCVHLLVGNNLIQVNNGFYDITAEGKIVLKDYAKLMILFEKFREKYSTIPSFLELANDDEID